VVLPLAAMPTALTALATSCEVRAAILGERKRRGSEGH